MWNPQGIQKVRREGQHLAFAGNTKFLCRRTHALFTISTTDVSLPVYQQSLYASENDLETKFCRKSKLVNVQS